jgi:hypothetical protein
MVAPDLGRQGNRHGTHLGTHHDPEGNHRDVTYYTCGC